MMISPEPNEISAASRLLFNLVDSSPLARVCSAIITPDNAANISKRTGAGYLKALTGVSPGATLPHIYSSLRAATINHH